MKRLILIDLSGQFWSAWHSTADQGLSEAFERTVRRCHSLREGYDYCAVACDAPPYHRKKLSAEYKQNRDAHPPQALEQFERTKARLVADGFLLWASPGAEADDVIATAVQRAIADELAVTIASSDKDLYCLVDDARSIQALSLATGQLVNAAAVREKFGVDPILIPELLALMGDSSDNVPGVPKVGVKTAAALLEKHGPTVEDVIANADDITKESLRKSIFDNIDAIRLSRELVRLDANVPIDWKELYAERKPQPLTKGQNDWTDAEFEKEEPVSAAEKQPEPEAKSEPKSDGPAQPEQVRAKPITAIIKPPAEWSMALEPASTRDAFIMARTLHESRLFNAYGSAEAVFAVILRGRALGLDATTALANFHVVEGKPTMSAGLIIGLILKSGKAEYFDLVETTRDRAVWETKRKGSKREARLVWTIEDAADAGLVTKTSNGYQGVSRSGKPSNWDKYRRTMLRWRAGVELARAVYPDIVAGLYTPDEVSDGQAQLTDAELEVA